MLRTRVSDEAGLLPPDARARLDAALGDFERETSHQIAILSVPSLGGEPIESFALRVAERAQLGQRGLDNGILLVVAVQERRARIEVGYGLEGVVPDAIAKRVLEDVIFPRFRQGDFAGGIEAGALALASAARGEVVPAERRPAWPPARTPGGAEPLAVVVFGAIFSSLLWLPLRRRARSLRAVLSGLSSGALTWLMLASLAWVAIGAGLGFLLGWLGVGSDVLFNSPRRGRGWSRGAWGSGGRGGGAGGFSGGGGRFGGGGASGGW